MTALDHMIEALPDNFQKDNGEILLSVSEAQKVFDTLVNIVDHPIIKTYGTFTSAKGMEFKYKDIKCRVV